MRKIETRATLIDTFDGQRVVVPNSDSYTNAVLVKTARYQRGSDYDIDIDIDIGIGIGYSDDIDQSCAIVRDTLGKVEEVSRKPASEALPWDLSASWGTIRARWWANSRQRDVSHVRARVVKAIKLALDDAGIDMPFETQVHLFHDQTDAADGERKIRWKVRRRDGETSPRDRR